MKKQDIFKVLENFKIDGELKDAMPYGEGHINQTFLVITTKKRYILQKMNTYVFPKHKELMENILNVTNHLNKKGIETLKLNYTKDGHHYIAGDECYRLYDFIENSITYQSAESPEVFEASGFSFGEFQNYLSDFDASKLHEVIANFHNTKIRYENFLKSLKNDAKNRAKDVQEEIDFINQRKNTYSKVVDLIAKGELPLRVTHNDTKLNNILFDATTNKPRAVIDLDTIMPGSLLYDFGDSIRFGASTAAEDEKDLSKVSFSLTLFKAYATGFLSAVKNSITEKELELIPFGCYLMTIECGMRFLTDYLDGDVYFKTHYDNHNLVRARTQLKLAKEMEENFKKMEIIVRGIMENER